MTPHDYWALFVYYSSHVEEGAAASARSAQEQIHPRLLECDPGYAHGMIVEMKAGDTFPPQNAPEDRKGYFLTDDEGNLLLVDKKAVYNAVTAAYTSRVGRE